MQNIYDLVAISVAVTLKPIRCSTTGFILLPVQRRRRGSACL